MIVNKGRIFALICAIGACIGSDRLVATHQQNIVVGTIIGNQVVTGTARVVAAPTHLHKVHKGDIVIASMTDVSWEPVLHLAAGIITDRGDEHCHAALFGKKIGIPVVVGTGDATKKILDGQRVTIDCDHNTIYVEQCSVETEQPLHHKTTVSKKEVPYAGGHSSSEVHGDKSKHYQQTNRFDVSKEKIRQDQQGIVSYMNSAWNNMWLGYWSGKVTVSTLYGVQSDVFDSMPLLFFKTYSSQSKMHEGLNHVFTDEADLRYVKENFVKLEQYKGKDNLIHPDILGRTLYRTMLDKLNISDYHRNILKKTPLKMEEFIKRHIVKKEEYLHYNILNFTIQYYLHKFGLTKY